MSNARFFSAIALTAVVTGTLVAGLTLSRPAHADAPRTATCAAISSLPKAETWINEQLAAGRTEIVTWSTGGFCAW